MLLYNCKRERKEVLKMTVQEIKEKIEQLKNRLFMMNMKDRWTSEDEIKVTEMENEIHTLELQIA
jgi:formate-dependent nitrite reductase cytochrome c552 subunit